MRAKKDSISFIFARYQAVIFSIILLFFLANSFFLYFEERKSIIAERSYQLEVAAGKVNSRIHNCESIVMETLTTIMNDYKGLWSDKDGKKYFDKQKLNQLIRNKRLLSDELEFFYAFRPDDFTVFQGGEAVGIYERLYIKDFALKNVDRIVTTAKENVWKVCDINGCQYLFYCYYYAAADIYVGIAVKPETLFGDLILLAGTYDGSFEVASQDNITYTFPGEGENTTAGGVLLDEIPLKGNMRVTSCFTIGILELFRNNLIITAVTGLFLCMIFVAYMNYLLKKTVIRPVQEMAVAVQNINDLAEQKKIPDDAEVCELRGLEKTINTLLQEVVYNRMKLYATEIQKREQELVLLRAQIRPHFFLNAITTVSMMTYQDRNEDIRSYLMKLSNFLRYVINSPEKLVTLAEELNNINNYFQMQDIRFPGKTVLFSDCEPEAGTIRIPRFILLTIIENSYKYALGTNDIMQLFIQCRRCTENGFEGVLITIEDNGNGFREDQLVYYNQPELMQESADQHIGLLNVKQTLALHFGRADLLRISNAIPNGAKFEIRIPDTADKDEINEGSDC